MTAVKFCGLRSNADVDAAIHVGCDLIGLNFVTRSPRFIDVATATEVVSTYGSKMLFVGVFKDPSEAEVRAVIDVIALDFLQFSGDESSDFCDSFELPYLKALHVGESFDFEQQRERFPSAFAYLLDSVSELGGGSGERFDWERFPSATDAKVFLAGGLNPDNVANAISQTKPWGVDVASGIEEDNHAKSRNLMTRFIQGVRSVST